MGSSKSFDITDGCGRCEGRCKCVYTGHRANGDVFGELGHKKERSWIRLAMIAAAITTIVVPVAVIIDTLNATNKNPVQKIFLERLEKVKQWEIDVDKRLLAMSVGVDDILFYKRGDVETIFRVHNSAGTLYAISLSGGVKTFWGDDEYGEEGARIVSDGSTEHAILLARAIEDLGTYNKTQEKLDPRDR